MGRGDVRHRTWLCLLEQADDFLHCCGAAPDPDEAAGYPADHVEAFKEAGVDIFIHVRANCYNTIEAIQNKIGL